MKKWLPVVIIFLVALGGIWFWSLGALPKEEISNVSLSELVGDVTTKLPGEEAFKKPNDNVELKAGTVIKTGTASSATVDFYGQSETEISENSELIIEESTFSEETEDTVIRLKLVAGRIWSRVISILDINGEFTVETSDVVATVRGTAFDMARDSGGTTLWVADSVVETDANEIIYIPENQMLRFQNKKSLGKPEAFTKQTKNTDWFKRNREKDTGFYQKLQNKLIRQVGGDRLNTPGFLRDITRGSEALRTSFSKKGRRERLRTRYLLRRFAIIQQQIKARRLGSAQKEFLKLRQDLLRAKDRAPADARVARKALLFGIRLFHTIDPTNEAYTLKQQTEDLLIELSPNKKEAIMLRLMFVQSRLSEARQALSLNRVDAAEQILSLAKSSHENVARDISSLDGEGDKTEKLTRIIHAIEVRMNHLEEAIQEAKSATSVRVIDSVEAVNTSVTGTRIGRICTDLHIRANPPKIVIGERSIVMVEAVLEDGSVKNVSQDAQIVVTGDIATIQGTEVTGKKPGNASVQVTYDCQGTFISRQSAITVTSPVTIKGIVIRPGVTQIAILKEIVLKVELLYSDGRTKNVTQNATFINLTPKLGFMAGDRFVAGQTEGSARVEVQYAEQGKEFTAIANIRIKQALQ